MDMGWSSIGGEMTQVEEPEVAMMEEASPLKVMEKVLVRE
jgi:hypothetical protein